MGRHPQEYQVSFLVLKRNTLTADVGAVQSALPEALVADPRDVGRGA